MLQVLQTEQPICFGFNINLKAVGAHEINHGIYHEIYHEIKCHV